MLTINIPASTNYDVQIAADGLSHLATTLEPYLVGKTIGLITDDHVWHLYGKTVVATLTQGGYRVIPYVFTHGEAHKNLTTVSEIVQFYADKLTRSDCLLALGGGITGDIAGFCGAIFLRGIDVIQLPTTFLAAVDSSVGGKTGVNLPAGKNLVGAFYQPKFVLCDYSTFQTLPPAVFADGIGEAIKYGMILNKELFTLLATEDLTPNLERVIQECVTLKSQVVAADEFDHGVRQLLNFGHTFGHGIEKCSDYQITHGHAVGIGMVMAARVAAALGVSEEDCLTPLVQCLTKYQLPVTTDLEAAELLTAMLSDKKRAGEQITLILPKTMGQCVLYPVAVKDLGKILAVGLKKA